MKFLWLFIAVFVFLSGVNSLWAYSSDDYYQAGKKLYMAKDYGNAVKYFAAAIKLDPNNAAALQARGNCYYTQGQYQSALADYQQVQALHPSDQMAAFIEKVKAKTGASSASAFPNGAAMAQGISYYQQKQYSQAIDSFEQATQQDPQNYKPFYYLGLSRLMNGDKRGGTLSLAISNELHPSAGLTAYVEKLKASLSGDDRSWVQANLNSYDKNNGMHHEEAFHPFGLRLEPGVGLVALGDFNADGQARVAYGKLRQQSGDISYQVTASVPAGYPDITVEPTYKLSSNFELGLPLGLLPIGSYTIVGQDGGSTTDQASIGISGFMVGLNARYSFGDSSFKFFVSGGPVVAPISLSYSETYGSPSDTYSGTSSSLAVGGQVEVGAGTNLGPGLGLSGFVGYRALQASGFPISVTDSQGVTSYPGQFYVVKTSYGNIIQISDSASAASYYGSGNYRPLTVDLSSILVGVQLSLEL